MLVVLTSGASVRAGTWYVPMGQQVTGGFDQIQLSFPTPYQFDVLAMTAFVGPTPVAELWAQTFINDDRTLAIANGPDPGGDPIFFAVYVSGDRQVDQPAFHFQTFLGTQLVDNADVICTGPGELDWVVQNGTWTNTDRLNPYFRPGDANYNGAVDIYDIINAWQLNYTGVGGTGKTWGQGNWNGDGSVDIYDALLWQLNYTGPIPLPSVAHAPDFAAYFTTTVPEPATVAVILTFGGLLALRRRGTGRGCLIKEQP
ncbi:MAG: PEP-CTERM sorting domain-containing protein [Phycisphaeraceae bacterium]